MDVADRGYQTIPTAAGFQALYELLAYRRIQTGVIPGEPRAFIPSQGRHSSLFTSIITEDRDPDKSEEEREDMRAKLLSLPPGWSRKAALDAYLGDHIRVVLRLGGKAIDPQKPLKVLGFHSCCRWNCAAVSSPDSESGSPATSCGSIRLWPRWPWV